MLLLISNANTYTHTARALTSYTYTRVYTMAGENGQAPVQSSVQKSFILRNKLITSPNLLGSLSFKPAQCKIEQTKLLKLYLRA